MNIRFKNITLDIDDESFFSWLMLQMLMFVDVETRKANAVVKQERVGFTQPRRVEVTINSTCDLLSVGHLLKLEPLTHFTFVFPQLKAEATMNLMIYSNSIDIHVKGKGESLSKSGTYDAIIDDVTLIYKKCWDGANIPVLYGQTCNDLLKLMKGKKDLKFIQTSGYNWPLFCNMMAKLMTCIAVAEPFRCLLMHPIAMMDLYLGKKKLRPLEPISNFTGSASALVNIQAHFEAERRDDPPVPLTTEGRQLLNKMSEIVVAWVGAVLAESKKQVAYEALIEKITRKERRPMELLQEMVSQKILRHLGGAMQVSFTSISEYMLDPRSMDEVD